jgi:hypothetical protein
MYVYLAEKNDLPYPIILPYVISLGILIMHSAALMPGREWRLETLGL